MTLFTQYGAEFLISYMRVCMKDYYKLNRGAIESMISMSATGPHFNLVHLIALGLPDILCSYYTF